MVLNLQSISLSPVVLSDPLAVLQDLVEPVAPWPSALWEAAAQGPIPSGVRAAGQRKGRLGANESHQYPPK